MNAKVFLPNQFDMETYLNQEDMFMLKVFSNDKDTTFDIEAKTSLKKTPNKMGIFIYVVSNMILFGANLWGCYKIIERVKTDNNSSLRFSLFLIELAVA